MSPVQTRETCGIFAGPPRRGGRFERTRREGAVARRRGSPTIFTFNSAASAVHFPKVNTLTARSRTPFRPRRSGRSRRARGLQHQEEHTKRSTMQDPKGYYSLEQTFSEHLRLLT
ncbi:unnamed protein product [Nezara viridula]|uniref:Uncharacterized protein n=1 Tax=Nezara viridula TaxID=85310 RepID=A0A9P0HBK8_NEZVI|nr:unnamed protein product [Nezara viridula]